MSGRVLPAPTTAARLLSVGYPGDISPASNDRAGLLARRATWPKVLNGAGQEALPQPETRGQVVLGRVSTRPYR